MSWPKTPTQHGHAKRSEKLSPTYRTWQAMLTRCNNPKSRDYKNYGVRGIKVCAGWHYFENFLAYMGERPQGMTIERKDTNGDYTPDNCVWATKLTQARNTRANSIIMWKGKSMTQAEFSEAVGIKQSTVSYRMRAGWTAEQIATTPPHTGNRVVSRLGGTVKVPEKLV